MGTDRNKLNTLIANKRANERKLFYKYWRSQGLSVTEVWMKWADQDKTKFYEELGRTELTKGESASSPLTEAKQESRSG